jgi:hypothetical protein
MSASSLSASAKVSSDRSPSPRRRGDGKAPMPQGVITGPPPTLHRKSKSFHYLPHHSLDSITLLSLASGGKPFISTTISSHVVIITHDILDAGSLSEINQYHPSISCNTDYETVLGLIVDLRSQVLREMRWGYLASRKFDTLTRLLLGPGLPLLTNWCS